MAAMELRHLRYFVAVAEEGHVTRAAERLGIKQPPLSQQIRALERELDILLFRRKPRGVELTDAGRALLDDARFILAYIDRAVATTNRTARGEHGRIAIGFTSTAPYVPFVPRVIRAFREAYPGVSLGLEENTSGQLVEALRDEKLDAIFIRDPVTNPSGIAVSLLLEEEMVIALPRGHALAVSGSRHKGAALSLEALATERFVLGRPPVGSGLYHTVMATFAAAGFTPSVAQEAPRMLSTLSLVASGLGITVVPESLQRLHLDGVVYRPLKGNKKFVAPLYLAYRRSENSVVVRRFIDLVRRSNKNSLIVGRR
jgi:DNA-binding transcriptional LysR family regulator